MHQGRCTAFHALGDRVIDTSQVLGPPTRAMLGLYSLFTVCVCVYLWTDYCRTIHYTHTLSAQPWFEIHPSLHTASVRVICGTHSWTAAIGKTNHTTCEPEWGRPCSAECRHDSQQRMHHPGFLTASQNHGAATAIIEVFCMTSEGGAYERAQTGRTNWIYRPIFGG